MAFVSHAHIRTSGSGIRELLTQTWQETLDRYAALEERFQAACTDLSRRSAPTAARLRAAITELRAQRRLLLRDARARLRGLPPEIRSLARRRYRRLRRELALALQQIDAELPATA